MVRLKPFTFHSYFEPFISTSPPTPPSMRVTERTHQSSWLLTGPTEYEKRRLAIMQRNALKMQELLGDELGAVREGRKRCAGGRRERNYIYL